MDSFQRCWVKLVLCVLLSLFLQACYYLQPSQKPIRTIFYPLQQDQKAPVKDLLVLLPGIGAYPEDFQRHAFLDALRAGGVAVDVLAVNAHYGYYAERSLLHRLKEDVVDPALAQGYERIHFAGISLGGYGTLLYMREYPDDVSSAVLLAPYLGMSKYYVHLLVDGGEAVALNDEANIWPWLASLDRESRSKIYLGYGHFDTYAASHRLLSDYLSAANVMVIEGDHGWTTWQILWPYLLDIAQLCPADDISITQR